jgi:hypothetical protein
MAINLEQANGGTFCVGKAGLIVGTTTSLIKTVATINPVIDGVYTTAKTATDNIAWAVPAGSRTDPITGASIALFAYNTTVPIGSKCSFGLWIDSAAAFTMTQGPIAAVITSTDKVAPPPNPGSRALVGVFTVYASTAVYTAGTTTIGTGNTVTYTDTFSFQAVNIA